MIDSATVALGRVVRDRAVDQGDVAVAADPATISGCVARDDAVSESRIAERAIGPATKEGGRIALDDAVGEVHIADVVEFEPRHLDHGPCYS